MTELEWSAGTNPTPLLTYISKPSTRKLRLLACGCCRRIWKYFKDERSRAAVIASEHYADREIDKSELDAAQQQAMLGKRHDEYVSPEDNAAASVARQIINPGWIAQLATRTVGNFRAWSVGTPEARFAQRAEADRV